MLEAAQPLAKEDPECAAVVLDRLAREGVDHPQRRQDRAGASRRAAKVEVVLATATARRRSKAAIFWSRPAGGRTSTGSASTPPASSTTPRGIVVDQRLRTTNKRVYAIGDVAGAPQFTHVANYHAGLVIRHALFRLPVKVERRRHPARHLHRSRTRPCRADRRCRRATRHGTIRVLRWPYHENDRAQAERETARPYQGGDRQEGADPRRHHRRRRGRRADHHLDAGDQPAAQYPRFCRNRGALSDLSEIGKRAAISFFTPRLTSPWVRRILGLLRRFG